MEFSKKIFSIFKLGQSLADKGRHDLGYTFEEILRVWRILDSDIRKRAFTVRILFRFFIMLPSYLF